MLDVRVLVVDHYIAEPIDELTPPEDSLSAKRRCEPVLRIFGTTPEGRKSCVHVHGVYPYLYVPYDGGENPDRDCLLLGAALNEALEVGTKRKHWKFVHRVTVASATPLYGYHSKCRQFFKIFLCDPIYVRKASELLLSGAILGQKLQPHESHIPYALQFMIDYNIYGMSFATFSKVKYRRDPKNPDHLSGVADECIFSERVKKTSCSYYEADVLAKDIVNKNRIGSPGGNPGLQAIWEDEKARRRARDGISQITDRQTESRLEAKMSAVEEIYKRKLRENLRQIHVPDATCESSRSIPSDEPKGLDSAEVVEENSADVAGSTGRDVSNAAFAADENGDGTYECEEERIEADSVLGRNREKDEEAELEDEDGEDMTQPLDSEESVACETDADSDESRKSSGENEAEFWKSMADKIFQLDGTQDSSSSESECEARRSKLESSECGGGSRKFSESEIGLDSFSGDRNSDADSISDWSNNILSILSEDTACPTPSTICQTPQTFWSNYSPSVDAMDSSWLSQEEPWTWNKNETCLTDGCFAVKTRDENLYECRVPTSNESSKEKIFGCDRSERLSTVTDDVPRSVGSPRSAPPSPSAISTPTGEPDASASEKPSPSGYDDDRRPAVESGVETRTVVVPKNGKTPKRPLENDKEKLMRTLKDFLASDEGRVEPGTENGNEAVASTFKQFIKDCGQIVNANLKSLSDREMIVIEYKPFSRKIRGNKFLIKPLDKFLENWKVAERKVKEELSKKGECERRRNGKVSRKSTPTMEPANGFETAGDGLRSLLVPLEHKYTGNWLDSSKIKSIRNKFVVKSMKILPDDFRSDSGKSYRVNENFNFSRGKIKMKLIKSASGEKNISGVARKDLNANHITLMEATDYREKKSEAVKRVTDKNLLGNIGREAKLGFNPNGSGMMTLPKNTKNEHRCEASRRRRENKTKNYSRLGNGLILNSRCFEEYFKNVIEVDKFHGGNGNGFHEEEEDGHGDGNENAEEEEEAKKVRGEDGEGTSEDERDDSETEEGKNPVARKRDERRYSSSGTLKFVTRLLDTFSRMSKTSEMPPLSITIALGNVQPPSSAPVRLHLQPTVELPGRKEFGSARFACKKPRRKTTIESFDGSMDDDGSSSDDAADGDVKRAERSSARKKIRKKGFYRPLNVFVQNFSGGRETRVKRRKISGLDAGAETEETEKTSLDFRRGDCFLLGRKNRKALPNTKEERQKVAASGSTCEENLIESKEISRKDSTEEGEERRGGRSNPGSRSNVVGPRSDFADDSDARTESAGSSRKRTNKKLAEPISETIPQADVALSSSDEEEGEKREERKLCRTFILKKAIPPEETEERRPMKKRVFGEGTSSILLDPSDRTPGESESSKGDRFESEPDLPSIRVADSNEEDSCCDFIKKLRIPVDSPASSSPGILRSGKSPSTKRMEATPVNLFVSSNSSEETPGNFSREPEFSSEPTVSFREENRANADRPALALSAAKTIRPERAPPTKSRSLEFARGMKFAGGSSDDAPFYGDPRDSAKASEIGPRILRIQNRSVAGLKTHKTVLGVSGAETRRNEILNSDEKMARYLFTGNGEITITPLRRPPSRGRVAKWTKISKRAVENDEKYSGLEKKKISIPLSPGENENSEDDSESSLTAQSLSLNDSIRENPREDSPKPVASCQPPNRISGTKIASKKKLETIFEETAKNPSPEFATKEQSSEDSFRIGGIVPKNTFNFSHSIENMRSDHSSHQYLSTMVMELHVETREDLRPDPRHDPIRALFYAIDFDDPDRSRESGIVAVGVDRGRLDVGSAVGTVHSVSTEIELFEKLLELLDVWDPDILAGYETEMSSWGYLVERGGFVYEMNLIPRLGRLRGDRTSSTDGAKDFGRNADAEFDDAPETVKNMRIPGRIVLDVWRILRHEISLTSYTFENVAYHLSRERHPRLSHRSLSSCWEHPGGKFRRTVVDYYASRVEGILKILDQIDFFNRTSELSRLFGIQFYEVLSRGSQFRVESMMLRLAKPLNYVPVSPSVGQRAAMRAPASLPLILEPDSVFHTDPVIVLDFQSLYPSMIIAYNYCFSTCLGRVENLGRLEPFEFGCTRLQISPRELRTLEDDDVNISPAGVAFVGGKIRRGVLPSMLEEILETRLMVKKSMKENKNNRILGKILDARQLGLKLIANVTYGYTAANFSGRMPCIEVGDSVVSKGRETLERAIRLVKSRAEEWGAEVVYGDTDSVFVLTRGKSRKEAFRIGAEIAEAVTRDNPKPVKLKLEKVYQPCILQTKKRYVGYKYENPDQEKPTYEAKGIETVRRDGCPATAKILRKCLEILFDTRDVSQVKKYAIRQFAKLFRGRVNLQDLIFAKEYRGRNGYRPGACVPALQLARRWTERDRRAEPRVKERVPYVIVNGPPGVPLIRLVRSPTDLLADPGLRINAFYYVTKAIVPPLQRCFSLLGVDVASWCSEVPRKHRRTYGRLETGDRVRKKSTISQYFCSAAECVVCSESSTSLVCERCGRDVQKVLVSSSEKLRIHERKHAELLKICRSCFGKPTEPDCRSVDCPVLFRRNQAANDLDRFGPVLRRILADFDF